MTMIIIIPLGLFLKSATTNFYSFEPFKEMDRDSW